MSIGFLNFEFNSPKPFRSFVAPYLFVKVQKLTPTQIVKPNQCFQFLSEEEAEEFERGKRGALDLAQIIKCATGCDPLLFKGYGCFCGYLGSGEPVDGIDT